MTPLLISGMQGLGDNIYQRAVLRELTAARDIYLETTWPQLYEDLSIRCVKPVTRLRTQAKNIASVPASTWHSPPANAQRLRLHYVGQDGTILQGLCKAVNLQARMLKFDAPTFPQIKRSEPYVVIRPATIRTEWHADSRNPRPEYLALAAEKLRKHFRIISVADLSPRVEWPVLPLPYADETFHAGELGVEQLLALVAGAAGLVGGVGWIVPAAIAYRMPLFLIFGGWGLHNGPKRIFDARLDISRIYQVVPDKFCMCSTNSHGCDKRITSIELQVDNFVRLIAGGKTSVVAGDGDRLVSSYGAAV